ncbi:HAMP domain-containing histidine kinase [Duganella sp. sic0402]|uniref:sensor histidine kinase n=1 Tax=Duganella sp. sic0402 TaxID=2854786 RepID=UPI001C472A0A|nr:HAMP domain-containing sensor histidine kinase [Duganella sp. sic0402]MBV7534327.1 HAMP domain-containing histidine kinase [Duganella sp. sic0402]
MINAVTEPTVRRHSLQWKVTLPFVLIGIVMTVGISFQAWLSQGLIVHPIWEQLLSSSTEQYLALARRHGDAPLPSEGPLRGWRLSGGPLPADMPAYFAQLAPGYYDEEHNEEPDFDHAVLVTAVGNGRIVMAVDITALEGQQNRNAFYSTLFWLLSMIMVTLSVLRIYRSLRLQMRQLARAMNALNPERPSERLPVDFQLVELHDIALLVNGHLDRVERFVERERSLLDQASHEFRTPIAVVAGAVDVLMQQPLPPKAMAPLQRIRTTTDNLTEIMAALLYLSREPDGKALNQSTRVDALLEVLVADHRHLLDGKLVDYVLDDTQPTWVDAPEAMVRIVIGNLLRNAAENSFEGAIIVALQGRCLTVRDCGIGFDIAAAARSYSMSLRNSAKLGGGQGLGLFLIRRICERFGWSLSITSTVSKGTLAELRF